MLLMLRCILYNHIVQRRRDNNGPGLEITKMWNIPAPAHQQGSAAQVNGELGANVLLHSE